eukprot:8179261-Pyramimonas_sp.AAC.1
MHSRRGKKPRGPLGTQAAQRGAAHRPPAREFEYRNIAVANRNIEQILFYTLWEFRELPPGGGLPY